MSPATATPATDRTLFAQATRSSHFYLSLSHGDILALAALHAGRVPVSHEDWAARYRIVARGLATSVPEGGGPAALTEAGRLMHRLLVLAGRLPDAGPRL